MADCCSMRQKSLLWSVYDSADRLILTTQDGPRAKKLAMALGGRYTEDWYDLQA
jgi:hypothetical protein